MNGVQEYNKKFIDKINNVLKNQPDFIKGYVNFLSDTSITTKYAYMNYVIGFIDKINKSIETLTLDDFSGYISDIEYKEDGSLTTSSYRIAAYSALKKFSNYLFVSKRISEDYMLSVKRPKATESQKTIEKRESGYLTSKEISKYIHTIEDNSVNRFKQNGEEWNIRDIVIIKVFLNTGIRCSALWKLDISSVDFENKTLIVTDKGDKVKKYDLSDDLISDICEWVELKKEKINDNNDALFISQRKQRMSSRAIYDVVKKYSKDIKNKNITPHKLRATYGTQLYKATGDIYFVQDCMNHANPKTTELYIRGTNKENTKKASDIMSKIIR